MAQKMDPRIKRLWVNALRSGKYKQGTRVLRADDNKFCCLGVLCNLHAIAHPGYAKEQTDPRRYGGHYSLPPNLVYEWAGLSAFARIHVNGRWTTLDRHNDRGASFAQIADAISKQL